MIKDETFGMEVVTFYNWYTCNPFISSVRFRNNVAVQTFAYRIKKKEIYKSAWATYRENEEECLERYNMIFIHKVSNKNAAQIAKKILLEIEI